MCACTAFVLWHVQAQEFSMEELIAAAEATHNANLAIADVEAAFLEGEHSCLLRCAIHSDGVSHTF
jgi:hypothetical protein